MFYLNKGSILACSFCAVLEPGGLDFQSSPNLLGLFRTQSMRSGGVV